MSKTNCPDCATPSDKIDTKKGVNTFHCPKCKSGFEFPAKVKKNDAEPTANRSDVRQALHNLGQQLSKSLADRKVALDDLAKREADGKAKLNKNAQDGTPPGTELTSMMLSEDCKVMKCTSEMHKCGMAKASQSEVRGMMSTPSDFIQPPPTTQTGATAAPKKKSASAIRGVNFETGKMGKDELPVDGQPETPDASADGAAPPAPLDMPAGQNSEPGGCACPGCGCPGSEALGDHGGASHFMCPDCSMTFSKPREEGLFNLDDPMVKTLKEVDNLLAKAAPRKQFASPGYGQPHSGSKTVERPISGFTAGDERGTINQTHTGKFTVNHKGNRTPGFSSHEDAKAYASKAFKGCQHDDTKKGEDFIDTKNASDPKKRSVYTGKIDPKALPPVKPPTVGGDGNGSAPKKGK